jgi:hypothetical protein
MPLKRKVRGKFTVFNRLPHFRTSPPARMPESGTHQFGGDFPDDEGFEH